MAAGYTLLVPNVEPQDDAEVEQAPQRLTAPQLDSRSVRTGRLHRNARQADSRDSKVRTVKTRARGKSRSAVTREEGNAKLASRLGKPADKAPTPPLAASTAERWRHSPPTPARQISHSRREQTRFSCFRSLRFNSRSSRGRMCGLSAMINNNHSRTRGRKKWPTLMKQTDYSPRMTTGSRRASAF